MKSISKNNLWIVFYVILGLVLAILLGLLIYFLVKKLSKSKPTSSPSPSPTESSNSSDTPKATIVMTKEQKNLNNVLREQVKGWGNDFNSMPEEKKNKIRRCYQHPEECSF